MKSVAIVGAGDFGREVIEIFKDQNKKEKKWKILGFIDEDEKLHGKKVNNYPVLGGLEWIKENNDEQLGFICAIGEPEKRKQIVTKLNKIGVNFYNAIHPSVIMSEFLELGQDVIICAGTTLTVNMKIGNHVVINMNCSIAHDTMIEDYCTLSPHVQINGKVHLAEGVNVGTGAAFLPNISVGKWSNIGLGAVVLKDIPEKVVSFGVPARVIMKKKK